MANVTGAMQMGYAGGSPTRWAGAGDLAGSALEFTDATGRGNRADMARFGAALHAFAFNDEWNIEMPRRHVQFTLIHLFLVATVTAIVCALAKIFGVVAVLFAMTLVGPAAALLALSRAGQDSFSAVGVGVTVSTFVFGIAGLGIETVVFLVPTPGLMYGEHPLHFWILAPFVFAYSGTLIGLVGSFHAIVLWHAVTRVRCWLASRSVALTVPEDMCIGVTKRT